MPPDTPEAIRRVVPTAAPPVVEVDSLTKGQHEAMEALVHAVELHSFCPIKLPESTARAVQHLHHVASRFFLTSSDQDKSATRALVPELGGGVALLGYNQPSPAKEIFRFRHSPHMPWPRDDSEFRAAVEAAETELRKVASVCASPLLATLAQGEQKLGGFSELCKLALGVSGIERIEADREPDKSPRAEDFELAQGNSKPLEHGTVRDDHCPFDLFHYYNRQEGDQVPNCTPHVDRGLVHVIVASNTPGLQGAAEYLRALSCDFQ